MAGCGVVYHVAGLNGFCLPDPSALTMANVEGTRAVVRAAGAAGVRRIVYTSSAATIGEAQGDDRHRVVTAPRQIPLALRALEVRGRAGGLRDRRRGGRGAGEREPVLGPGPRAHPRHGEDPDRRAERPAEADRSTPGCRSSTSRDCAEGHLLAEERGGPASATSCRASRSRWPRPSSCSGGSRGGTSTRDACRRRWRWGWRRGPSCSAGRGSGARRSAARWSARSCTGTPTTAPGRRGISGLVYTPIEDSLRRTVEWYVAEGLVTRPLPGVPAPS